MTEKEWLEARARGLALRRNIEDRIANVLLESGIMKDCEDYIKGESDAEQLSCYDNLFDIPFELPPQ